VTAGNDNVTANYSYLNMSAGAIFRLRLAELLVQRIIAVQLGFDGIDEFAKGHYKINTKVS
jgi:hypothetical protein